MIRNSSEGLARHRKIFLEERVRFLVDMFERKRAGLIVTTPECVEFMRKVKLMKMLSALIDNTDSPLRSGYVPSLLEVELCYLVVVNAGKVGLDLKLSLEVDYFTQLRLVNSELQRWELVC